jgi:hypothetical protein
MHQRQATCHSQILGSHSCSTHRHHPIGCCCSISGDFSPHLLLSEARPIAGVAPCLFDFSHLVVKSRVRSTHLSTRTHGSFTSTPLTQSSIFTSCAWTALAIGLARRHNRRCIQFPDLASSHSMIVARPGAKLPLSPTSAFSPQGVPIGSRCVLVMEELDGIIVLPCRCHKIFILSYHRLTFAPA